MILQLTDLLRANNAYSEALLKELANRVLWKQFASQELVLRKGEVCDYLYFIIKGILRSYISKEDKQTDIWYMTEGKMAAAADSFFLQVPSRENIEAFEETEVICISHDDLWLVADAFPDFKSMVLKLLGNYYAMFYRRSAELVTLTKEERYQELIENQPELAQRLPLTLLKSYMGMSQASLSRIRDKGKGKRKGKDKRKDGGKG